MLKNFSLTFNLNCLINRGFVKSTGLLKNEFSSISSRTRELNGILKSLDDQYLKGAIGLDAYAVKAKMANKELADLNTKQKQMTGIVSSVDSLAQKGGGLIAFGAAVYGLAQPLMGVVKTAAEFEAAMSKVGAITSATDSDMKLLTKTARTLGATTQFTATQSAEAMSYLSMAGWKTNQIVAGMPGLLNLAAAGGTNLARTADIVSDNLTAFGLSAEQTMHMADVYATVITNTNTNVEMLGDTMKYAAPVARAFGASMEETAALAGMMANAGIKASQAGTALRAGFLRLAGPPKMAQKAMDSLGMSMNDITAEQKEAALAMKSLGISMSDTGGPKKMSAILTELRNKTRELGNEEKLAAMKAIFGTEAATGWIAVLDSSDGTFEKLVNQLEKCDGASDKLAKRMQDNAKGAATRLQSAMESVAISIGSTVLPAVAGITETLAKYTGVIAQVAGEHPALISGIIEVGASVVGLVGAVKLISLGIAAYNVVVKLAAAHQLIWNAALSANPIGLLIIGIGGLIAIGYQLYKNWDTISEGLAGMWGNLKNAAANCWNGVVGAAKSAWNGVKNIATIAGTFVKDAFMGYVRFWLNFPAYVAIGVGYIVGFVSTLPQRIKVIIDNTAEAVGSFVVRAKEFGKESYTGFISWMTNLPERVIGIIDNTAEAGRVFITRAGEWGRDGLNGLIKWFIELPDMLANIASDAWERAKGVISRGYENVKAKIQLGYEIGVAEGKGGYTGLEPVRQNAYGGIYPKGAFLTSFAENSGESAIPHTPTVRNVGLLARTNEIMGNPLNVDSIDLQSFVNKDRNEVSRYEINAPFAPTINIQGSADENKIRKVLEDEMAKFKRVLEDLQRNQRRVSYA